MGGCGVPGGALHAQGLRLDLQEEECHGQEEDKTSGGGDGAGRRGERGLEGGVADELSRGTSVCALV